MTDAQRYAKRLPPYGPSDFDWDACMNGTGDAKPNGLTAETARLMVQCDRGWREFTDAVDRAFASALARGVDAEIMTAR